MGQRPADHRDRGAGRPGDCRVGRTGPDQRHRRRKSGNSDHQRDSCGGGEPRHHADLGHSIGGEDATVHRRHTRRAGKRVDRADSHLDRRCADCCHSDPDGIGHGCRAGLGDCFCCFRGYQHQRIGDRHNDWGCQSRGAARDRKRQPGANCAAHSYRHRQQWPEYPRQSCDLDVE